MADINRWTILNLVILIIALFVIGSDIIGLKNVGRARSYNFLINIANVRQNSNRKQQISNREDYECSKFPFCP